MCKHSRRSEDGYDYTAKIRLRIRAFASAPMVFPPQTASMVFVKSFLIEKTSENLTGKIPISFLVFSQCIYRTTNYSIEKRGAE